MIIDFYSNNDLILTKKEIGFLESTFISSAHEEKNWDDFFPLVSHILEKSFTVYEYCQSQYVNNLGLQGGKILEIVIGDTLSKIFNATYIGNGIYSNTQYTITLTGDSGKGRGKENIKDIEIIDKKNNTIYKGEIKDEIARCGECDLKYDEKGHLFPAKRAVKWDDAWWPVLNAFNDSTCMFDIFGHNFKINHFTEACGQVAQNYFKNIDFLFTHKEDKLITIPLKDFNLVKNLFCFDGSEIRSNGKNPVNCFTPIYMENTIKNSQYFIDITQNGDYIVSQSMLINKTGRGGGKSSRYGFIPGFIVKKDGVIFYENGSCQIKKSSIKQLNSNISIHLSIKKNYNEIKYFIKENENDFFK